jgi:signal transduction histidine kinase
LLGARVTLDQSWWSTWLGDSEMAGRVLAFDWSATSLGPFETWPHSLRVATSICLHTQFQTAIYWGEELICIYNDAERDVLGALHPGALGLPARTLLHDSWDVLEPQLSAVMTSAEPTQAVNQPLRFARNGVVEVGYFTYSYSAIIGDDGRVGGVLLVSEDTTAHVLAERRLEALRDLTFRSMDAGDDEQACRSVAAALDERPDVPFTLIHLLGRDGAGAVCVAAGGLSGDLACISADAVFRGLAEHRTGTLVRVPDLFPGADPKAGVLPARAFAVPVARGSADPVSGLLVAGISDELTFDDAYRGFLETVAIILGRSVASARERATERERSARDARAEERLARETELRALLSDLRAAQRRIAEAGDDERRRIERNLHDGAQQRLMAIRLELGLLAERLDDPGAVVARAELERLRGDLDDALDELRELAHGLHPPLLASDGLYAALSAACRRAPLQIELAGADVGRLPRAIETAVYFCCLEAMQNAVKHAGASARIWMRVELRDEMLVWRVGDDGVGFDPGATARGAGLTNLRDRLGALGGRADIVSEPGCGTTVSGAIPLP